MSPALSIQGRLLTLLLIRIDVEANASSTSLHAQSNDGNREISNQLNNYNNDDNNNFINIDDNIVDKNNNNSNNNDNGNNRG